MRNATAIHLPQSGVDITVIAMWLGHEYIATTYQYIEVDLAMKEAALRRMDRPTSKSTRFSAGDRLLAFLETFQLCSVPTPLCLREYRVRRRYSA